MPLINFAGLASGIDSEALIEATTDSTRQARVEPKQKQIDSLTDTNESLAELKTKLTSLKSLVEEFASYNGGPLAKYGVSSDETIVTATASNSAHNGTYGLDISQVAQNATQSLASLARTYTSTSDPINPDMGATDTDTVTVHIGNSTGGKRETVDVTVTNSTTLDQFVSDFNASSDNATASVVNVGTATDPNYIVVISSHKQGLVEGEITVDLTAAPNLTGDGSGAFDNNGLSQAQDAEFSVAGIAGTITRPSNTVSDLIPGVTFSVATEGEAIISITTDTATTASNIEEFVELFNEIVEFINENNLVERQEEGEDVENIFSPLAKTRIDDNVLSSIRRDLTASSVSDSAVSIFADLGITTERNGTLKLDSNTLEKALNEAPEAARSIIQKFADTTSITGGTIDQYIRFGGLFDSTTKGNTSQITRLNQDISQVEKYIARQEEQLRARFARLERVMSEMQSKQSSLTSILSGLQ